MDDLKYSLVDDIYYEEALEHLKTIKVYFDMDFGPQDQATAEC